MCALSFPKFSAFCVFLVFFCSIVFVAVAPIVPSLTVYPIIYRNCNIKLVVRFVRVFFFFFVFLFFFCFVCLMCFLCSVIFVRVMCVPYLMDCVDAGRNPRIRTTLARFQDGIPLRQVHSMGAK